jgi:hypothetical protein
MRTLKIELTDTNSLKVLQDLEHKNLIRIVKEPDLNSYSLPGEPICEEILENVLSMPKIPKPLVLPKQNNDGHFKRRNSKSLFAKGNRTRITEH